MQNYLGANYPPEERRRFLSDNCDRVEDLGYMKMLTPDEQANLKDNLADVSIQRYHTEAEKKGVTADLNETLKSLKKKYDKILQSLNDKGEYVTEPCYVFYDHETKKVGYYNAEGLLVSSRAMRPQEMQKTLFEVKRGDQPLTGTDD